MNLSFPLILASKSPRRKQILEEAGFQFTVRTKEVEETYPSSLEVHEVAKFLAQKKAIAFENDIQNSEVIITADTTVVLDDSILGKAPNEEAAFEMLERLSGRSHLVISGVCLFSLEKNVSFSQTTEVYLKDLAAEEIKYYVKNYEPFDKAGAYGIQEWLGMTAVTKIVGDYYNVVGLPIQRVYDELTKW